MSNVDASKLCGLVAAIDRRLDRLAAAGLIRPHQSCTGEEAVLVGASRALAEKDWVFWGRQVTVPALLRGLEPEDLFADALFASRAAAFAARRIVVCSQGPAARLPHAAGLAWAARKDGVCALAELGDGALADGDVHVGLNFAAVLRAPVVFVFRSEGDLPVAERGEGYGIPTEIVDGHSEAAVFDAVSRALAFARGGNGPTLIEARVQRGRKLEVGRVTEHENAVERALAVAELSDQTRAVDMP